MSTDPAPDHPQKFEPASWLEAGILALIGVAVFLAGRYLADDGSAAGQALQILGGLTAVLAPLSRRAVGDLVLSFKDGLKMRLDGVSPDRRAAVTAVVASDAANLDAITMLAKTPHAELGAVLPFLSHEVASGRFTIPAGYAELYLAHPQLAFIRQELALSVVALRHPGQERWAVGGQVSELRWAGGTEILACGPQAALDAFKDQLIARVPKG